LRILDDLADKKLDSVSLFLTREEAAQLQALLNQLIDNPKLQHSHLSSMDYQKEVTVCLYDEQHLEGLHQRVKKLIKEDK